MSRGLRSSRRPGNKKGGGDAGGFAVLHGHLHEWEKVQMMGRHRERRIASSVPRAGGLRPASPDPWETPFISHWRTFSALLRRVGTRPKQAAKEGPVTSGTARRNQTTSAAARRVRYAPALQPPLPARDIETLRDAPLKTSRVYRLVPVKPWAGTHMNIIL